MFTLLNEFHHSHEDAFLMGIRWLDNAVLHARWRQLRADAVSRLLTCTPSVCLCVFMCVYVFMCVCLFVCALHARWRAAACMPSLACLHARPQYVYMCLCVFMCVFVCVCASCALAGSCVHAVTRLLTCTPSVCSWSKCYVWLLITLLHNKQALRRKCNMTLSSMMETLISNSSSSNSLENVSAVFFQIGALVCPSCCYVEFPGMHSSEKEKAIEKERKEKERKKAKVRD